MAGLTKVVSDETRKKLSELRRGVPKSAEHKAKIAASMRGQKRTLEQCARISAGKRGPNPTYSAAHRRMGSASLHTCQCGAQACDWALQPTCQDPLVSPRGLKYSANPDDYKPMCRKCHSELDAVELRRAADGTFR